MTPRQSDLFNEYVRWARRLGARWARLRELRSLDKLFAQSVAEQGLWDAVKKFKTSRKIHFMTYAQHRIHGTLQDWARSMTPGCRSKYFRNFRISKLKERDKYIVDQKAGNGMREIDFRDTVNKILGRMPAGRHRYLLRALYLKHKSALQVAKAWKCTESRVSQIKFEALQMAREGIK